MCKCLFRSCAWPNAMCKAASCANRHENLINHHSFIENHSFGAYTITLLFFWNIYKRCEHFDIFMLLIQCHFHLGAKHTFTTGNENLLQTVSDFSSALLSWLMSFAVSVCVMRTCMLGCCYYVKSISMRYSISHNYWFKSAL